MEMQDISCIDFDKLGVRLLSSIDDVNDLDFDNGTHCYNSTNYRLTYRLTYIVVFLVGYYQSNYYHVSNYFLPCSQVREYKYKS